MKTIDEIYPKTYLTRAPSQIEFTCHHCDRVFEDGEEIFTDYLHIININDTYANNVCRNCIVELRKLGNEE